MADHSKGGIRPPETHDHRQWTAEYVGSLTAWTTTTGDNIKRAASQLDAAPALLTGYIHVL